MEPREKNNVEKVARMDAKDKKLSDNLLQVVVISALGSLQYGYNLWVVYSPSVLVQDFYNPESEQVEESGTNEENLMLITAVSVSMFAIGGMAGSLLVGPMVDKLGRKGALLINSFFSMVACLLMFSANLAHSFGFVMFSRLLIGITIGIFSSTVPIYLAEISPVNSRGFIGMFPQLFLCLGVLLAQILALREVLGTPEGWPIIMSLSGILAMFQLIIMPTFPESPRYLIIQKKKEEEGRKALRMLRGEQDIEDEIKEIKEEGLYEPVEEKYMNALNILCYPPLRWQVFCILILMSGQQFSGVNAVYYYTEKTYQATKIGDDNIRYISMVSTVLILASMLLAMQFVDSKGRKCLLLIGFGMSGMLCVVLGLTIAHQSRVSLAIINSILLNVFLSVHGIGPSTLPVLLIAELFLQSSRSSAYVVGGFVHWTIHFFTVLVFLQIQPYIGAYSFLICFLICTATCFYIHKMIPETHGLTFLEIRKAMPSFSSKKCGFSMQPGPKKDVEPSM